MQNKSIYFSNYAAIKNNDLKKLRIQY